VGAGPVSAGNLSMDPIARLFTCAGCRQLRAICPGCDRGNRYCCRTQAADARRTSVRAAGRRYQHSLPGRFTHAARQRRYRARQKVTHQGSAPAPVAVSLPRSVPGPPAVVPVVLLLSAVVVCCVCGRACAPSVRRGFIRRGIESRRSRRSLPGA
jgi:hypothetical protein